jgi:hypothetical protein
MNNGHLHCHYDALADPDLAPHEVGHDDELPVPRSKRVHDSVDKSDPQPKEERAHILSTLDRLHVLGDFRIGPPLEFHDEVRPTVPEAAFVLGELHGRHGHGTRLLGPE